MLRTAVDIDLDPPEALDALDEVAGAPLDSSQRMGFCSMWTSKWALMGRPSKEEGVTPRKPCFWISERTLIPALSLQECLQKIRMSQCRVEEGRKEVDAPERKVVLTGVHARTKHRWNEPSSFFIRPVDADERSVGSVA